MQTNTAKTHTFRPPPNPAHQQESSKRPFCRRAQTVQCRLKPTNARRRNAPFRSTQGGTCRRGCGGGAGHRRYRARRDASCASRHARGPPRRAPASCGSSRNGTAAQSERSSGPSTITRDHRSKKCPRQWRWGRGGKTGVGCCRTSCCKKKATHSRFPAHLTMHPAISRASLSAFFDRGSSW